MQKNFFLGGGIKKEGHFTGKKNPENYRKEILCRVTLNNNRLFK